MGRAITIIFILFIIFIFVPLIVLQNHNINYKKREMIVTFMLCSLYGFFIFLSIVFIIETILYV